MLLSTLLLALLILQYFLVSRSTSVLFLFFSRFLPRPFPHMLIAILYFPGTLVHELAHVIAAALLFIPVRGIYLLPSWNNHSLTLGHVVYERRDFVRGFLIGIAPLPAALVVLWFLFINYDFFSQSITGLIMLGYLLFAITSTMFYSKSDLKDGGVFLLFAVLGYGALRPFGMEPEAYVLEAVQSSGINSALSAIASGAVLLLGIAVVINLSILLILGPFVYRRPS